MASLRLMGFPPFTTRTVRRLSATLLVAAWAGEAAGQVGPGGGALNPGGASLGTPARSGPGPKIPPGFGGQISGRLNLIGPSPTETAAPPLLAPPIAPAPIFAPQRIDAMSPAAIDRLRLPTLAPGALARPVILVPKPPVDRAGPTDVALKPSDLPVAPAKQRLTLAASFAENGARIPSGVKWRLFTDQADGDGEHMLVAESSEAAPRFEVDPGSYIVHAVYGLVSAAKFLTVKPGQPANQTVVLAAGAVRLTALAGPDKTPADDATFRLTREVDGVTRTVAEHVKAGTMLRLPAGRYHVTSLFGDANAAVDADLDIAPGKLVEAQVHHKAARVALKLVRQPGGSELPDTSWTVMTPGGDVIRDSIGALSSIVLAEGDYTAIARRDGQLYQQSFSVKAGVNESVEVKTR